MNKLISVLPGDGIGPEVMAEALRVLEAVTLDCNISFQCEHGLIGGAAWDETGEFCPQSTLDLCAKSDAILFGSVGGPSDAQHLPKWKGCEASSILALRKAFRFNANFRPSKVYPALVAASPLKDSLLSQGVDLLIVRELLGGIYFGNHSTKELEGEKLASDLCEYSESQIESVATIAFEAANKRRKVLTLVDKANVLDCSRLWRSVVDEVATNYPSIEYNKMYVDNCAMQLVSNPASFDVVLTENMFGDILSDLAAVLPGSLGILCSSSVNSDGFALYEPPGGSAPDIAGQNIANPIGQIRCVAMMLQHSFGMEALAEKIEKAVNSVLTKGYRTKDIFQEGNTLVSTTEMCDRILEEL